MAKKSSRQTENNAYNVISSIIINLETVDETQEG